MLLLSNSRAVWWFPGNAADSTTLQTHKQKDIAANKLWKTVLLQKKLCLSWFPVTCFNKAFLKSTYFRQMWFFVAHYLERAQWFMSLMFFVLVNPKIPQRETKNISTDADSRTDTILERLRDLSTNKKKYIFFFIT